MIRLFFTQNSSDQANTEAAESAVTITNEAATTTATTTTAAETTVPDIVIDRLSTYEYMKAEKAMKDCTLKWNESDASDIFYTLGDHVWLLWRFGDNGIVGVGKDILNAKAYNDHDYENSENVTYAEAYAGFTANLTDGRYLSVEHYYNDYSYECTDVKITFMDGSEPNYTVASNKDLTADLYDASYTNGEYAITAEYLKDGVTYQANMYLNINSESNAEYDFEAYICYGCYTYKSLYEDKNYPIKRQQKVEEMIVDKGITPENSLDYDLAYPYEAAEWDNYQYDTDYLINISDEVMEGHEDAYDAYKALLLHDWMTENLIYDDYKANYLRDPRYWNHYDTGEYYVSQCNVGVCRDFVNIYAIMCRRAGVHCVILGNSDEGHVWNAVYLYDHWLEVDLTTDIQRIAADEDVTDVTPANNENTHCYTAFCNYYYSRIMPNASEVNKWLHFR